jgi:hypothetical protein
MKSWRVILAVVAVVVWGLSAPLAMASDHCMAMGAVCEGPCGASTCATAPPTIGTASDEVGTGIFLRLDQATSVPLSHPEPPPKLLPRSA